MMRICSSVGSVTFAVPLLVTAISFLLLEVLKYVVQPVEQLRPGTLVGHATGVDGIECMDDAQVQQPAPLLSHVHLAPLPDHPQLLRYLGLLEPQALHEVVDGALPAGEHVEDLAAAGLGDGVERVGCGRGPGHGPNIFLYRNMS